MNRLAVTRVTVHGVLESDCDGYHKADLVRHMTMVLVRCIVYISKSHESGESGFLLRLTPFDLKRGRGAEEVCADQQALMRRLNEVGLSNCICRISLSNLSVEGTVVWPDCDVSDKAFGSFGKVLAAE